MPGDFISSQSGVIEAVMQSILECRRMARRIEEAAEGFMPLLDPNAARAIALVAMVSAQAHEIEQNLKELFQSSAREVFQEKK